MKWFRRKRKLEDAENELWEIREAVASGVAEARAHGDLDRRINTVAALHRVCSELELLRKSFEARVPLPALGGVAQLTTEELTQRLNEHGGDPKLLQRSHTVRVLGCQWKWNEKVGLWESQ